MGVCVACTKENVVQREEGEITIVPVWENFTSSFRPNEIKYYFYNLYDHSSFPVIIKDSTGRGVITQVLPVGTYQLVGYNTNVNPSANVIFDDTKNLTVVAKFSSYPYSVTPFNLCIISSEEILIEDKDVKTQEIFPVLINTKSLELVFKPGKNLTINKIRGTLDGAFASINLVNGKSFEDEGDIFFDVVDPDKKVKFRISDVYSSDSFSSLYKSSMLSLTLEVSEKDSNDNIVIKTKTGEVNLSPIIEDIHKNKIPDDNITLYVDINNYEKFEEKVALTVAR
jgi:hypothetical protein